MEWLTEDNDTRGWILCFVSGAACVAGSSVICVDLLIRLLPGKTNFSINQSSVFLASSLSLSFGVMLFSSLYSMLPNAKEYFINAGYNSQSAGGLMVAWFVCGFIGIQFISTFLHRYIPSHVVDCDHHHDGPHQPESDSHSHAHSHPPSPAQHHHASRPGVLPRTKYLSEIPSTIHKGPAANSQPVSESTPLLVPDHHTNGNGHLHRHDHDHDHDHHLQSHGARRPHDVLQTRRQTAPAYENAGRIPPMVQVQERVMSFVKDLKGRCDETGPCYGYSDPCGQECFKHMQTRAQSYARRVSLLRAPSGSQYPGYQRVNFPRSQEEEPIGTSLQSQPHRTSRPSSRDSNCDEGLCAESAISEDVEAQHHHHVPTNAFLSIGLQTSIAIALHKFPEGFITYATNHANPTLGFNVFMALFVHNITEGFTIALPLYMALGSRLKAMLWASLLGGLSQPLGAAVAALWFRLVRRTHMTPNTAVYASLFAITAGIMVSVALQLFVESLSLNHNRNLSIFFAFSGMVVLGLSNALVDDH
ncbi:hypothetical protein jhhlp_001990 [Lomentospora prolificans]|uniref:Zinc/iron permease n=1 Tax=Lomentospora prolificans TaxID=41688 RepID=A0A2N3NCS1_9PEZI|nr:hypothetical protein jhhlp_001990 [Lomentospora prolificans]